MMEVDFSLDCGTATSSEPCQAPSPAFWFDSMGLEKYRIVSKCSITANLTSSSAINCRERDISSFAWRIFHLDYLPGRPIWTTDQRSNDFDQMNCAVSSVAIVKKGSILMNLFFCKSGKINDRLLMI
jgi:hypothetical protein